MYVLHDGVNDRRADALSMMCGVNGDINDMDKKRSVANDSAHTDNIGIMRNIYAVERPGQASLSGVRPLISRKRQ